MGPVGSPQKTAPFKPDKPASGASNEDGKVKKVTPELSSKKSDIDPHTGGEQKDKPQAAALSSRPEVQVIASPHPLVRPVHFHDRWEALRGLYELEYKRFISQTGKYNDVYCFENIRTGKAYAVKSWKYNVHQDPKAREFTGTVKGEISALRVPEHKNLVKTHALIFYCHPSSLRTESKGGYVVVRSEEEQKWLIDTPDFYYKLKLGVCDLVEGDDLLEVMRRHSKYHYGEFSAGTAIKAGLELANGLCHLHAAGVVHRDIKLENILFDGKVLKLIDFGLSKPLRGDDRTKTSCGSPEYAAPDLFRGDEYDHRADVWSLGAVMLILATKFPPGYLYEDKPRKPADISVLRREVRQNVTRFADKPASEKRVYFQKHFPGLCDGCPGLVDLLLLIFTRDCKGRISAADAAKYLEILKANPGARLPVPLETMSDLATALP